MHKPSSLLLLSLLVFFLPFLPLDTFLSSCSLSLTNYKMASIKDRIIQLLVESLGFSLFQKSSFEGAGGAQWQMKPKLLLTASLITHLSFSWLFDRVKASSFRDQQGSSGCPVGNLRSQNETIHNSFLSFFICCESDSFLSPGSLSLFWETPAPLWPEDCPCCGGHHDFDSANQESHHTCK